MLASTSSSTAARVGRSTKYFCVKAAHSMRDVLERLAYLQPRGRERELVGDAKHGRALGAGQIGDNCCVAA